MKPNALTPCPSPGGRGEPANSRAGAGRSCQESAAALGIAKSTAGTGFDAHTLASASGFDAQPLRAEFPCSLPR